MTKVSLLSLLYMITTGMKLFGSEGSKNDLYILNQMQTYPNNTIEKAATQAFSHNLWYFYGHLVTLALFDDRVDSQTKQFMVNNFTKQKNGLKRQDGKKFDYHTPLEAWVTSGSVKLFSLLSTNGQEEAESFLSKPPAMWHSNDSYLAMKKKADLLRVVNDCAERGIALIQCYDNTLTQDENQKQYLLQIVHKHRSKIPVPTKKVIREKK